MWSLERLMTTSKIYDIIFRGGPYTQQDFRKRVLNLTGRDPYPYVSGINFTRWSFRNIKAMIKYNTTV